MAATAQAILDAIASIEETDAAKLAKTADDLAKHNKATAGLPGRVTVPGTPSLGDMMKTTLDHPQMKALASHPDFPALAQDSGVQSLVSALTNQVGTVLRGIKGSGQNVVTTLGD